MLLLQTLYFVLVRFSSNSVGHGPSLISHGWRGSYDKHLT